MAEGVIKHSVGLLIAGIKSISTLISEYNLRNENVLSLHREILNLRPCIENLKVSMSNSGVHNRLQRLLILMEEIKIWLEVFATKSCLRHFFFALIHKKEINKFYIRIQELKMEMGFEMKVDSHLYQQKLSMQLDELMEKLKSNIDYEQIKELIELQKNIYEMKFENHLSIIQNVDLKYSKLISEYEVELDEVKQRSYEMQNKINAMEQRLHEMNEKIILLDNCRKCNNKKEYLEYLEVKIDKRHKESEKELMNLVETRINDLFFERQKLGHNYWSGESNREQDPIRTCDNARALQRELHKEIRERNRKCGRKYSSKFVDVSINTNITINNFGEITRNLSYTDFLKIYNYVENS